MKILRYQNEKAIEMPFPRLCPPPDQSDLLRTIEWNTFKLEWNNLQLEMFNLIFSQYIFRMKLKLCHFQMRKMNSIYQMKYLSHQDRVAQTTMMMVSGIEICMTDWFLIQGKINLNGTSEFSKVWCSIRFSWLRLKLLCKLQFLYPQGIRKECNYTKVLN